MTVSVISIGNKIIDTVILLWIVAYYISEEMAHFGWKLAKVKIYCFFLFKFTVPLNPVNGHLKIHGSQLSIMLT